MQDWLSEIASRPRRYEDVDGTTEMSFGLIIFSFILTGQLSHFIQRHGDIPRGLIGPVVVGTLFLLTLSITLLTRTIKNRITYRRTGYLSYRRISKDNRWKAVMFVIGVCALAATLAVIAHSIRSNDESGVLRAAMVFGFLAPYASFALNASKEHFWKRYVIVGMAAGLILIVVLGGGGTERLSQPVMVFSGLTWLLSGAATLTLYLRRTQATPDGEE